jgi:quercetin dioxygenase-like cupin family protein
MIIENNKVIFKRINDKTSRKILSVEGSLMMVEGRYKKDGIGEVHSHDKYEQVSYIVWDCFEVTVGNEKNVLKKGDGYCVPLNVMHGVKALEDSIIFDVFTPIREDLDLKQ